MRVTWMDFLAPHFRLAQSQVLQTMSNNPAEERCLFICFVSTFRNTSRASIDFLRKEYSGKWALGNHSSPISSETKPLCSFPSANRGLIWTVWLESTWKSKKTMLRGEGAVSKSFSGSNHLLHLFLWADYFEVININYITKCSLYVCAHRSIKTQAGKVVYCLVCEYTKLLYLLSNDLCSLKALELQVLNSHPVGLFQYMLT